jgi:hypothetical protein
LNGDRRQTSIAYSCKGEEIHPFTDDVIAGLQRNLAANLFLANQKKTPLKQSVIMSRAGSMDSGTLGKTVVLCPPGIRFSFFHHFCAPCFGALGSCHGRPPPVVIIYIYSYHKLFRDSLYRAYYIPTFSKSDGSFEEKIFAICYLMQDGFNILYGEGFLLRHEQLLNRTFLFVSLKLSFPLHDSSIDVTSIRTAARRLKTIHGMTGMS